MKRVPRILLGCTSAGALVLARLLGGEAELVPVFSLDEATRALAQHVDLILCMTGFDDSRMFDFLRFAHERFASVPFVACDIGMGMLGAQGHKAVVVAALNVGARAYVELDVPEGPHGSGAPDRLHEVLDSILESEAPAGQ
jgi:hypothetical protein